MLERLWRAGPAAVGQHYLSMMAMMLLTHLYHYQYCCLSLDCLSLRRRAVLVFPAAPFTVSCVVAAVDMMKMGMITTDQADLGNPNVPLIKFGAITFER